MLKLIAVLVLVAELSYVTSVPKYCGINEIYYPCSKPLCLPETCENIGNEDFDPNFSPKYPCKGECRCKPGYYRNKIGQCISEADCKKCPGKYEYFACDNACDNECAKLSYQSHANCPIINVVCNPMCYCLEGYARDANKKCIPISKCPPPCKLNEEYSTCPNAVCRPKTCSDLGFPIACPDLNGGNNCGQPMCICKEGYVKDKIGVCVPARSCPSCGGDRNAWSGCGNHCTTCSNYKNKGTACAQFCEYNGCDCRPNYVYDDSKNKCVLPQQCPLINCN